MKIAVVGSGYMGGGIAQTFALRGHQVSIADASLEIADRNLARLLEESALWESRGLFDPGSTEQLTSSLSAAAIPEAVADAELVIEAVTERVEVKEGVLRDIAASAGPGCIIGTNTSTISIGTLAGFVSGPGRFLGLHYSNPAPFVPGVEVIPHADTDPAVVSRARDMIEETGKVTAVVKDVPGFVLNRLQFMLFQEAAQIVDEGIASAEDVDKVVRSTYGFRLPFFGPFQIADMAGLDVYGMGFDTLEAAFEEGKFSKPEALRKLVESGHYGTKSGKGFYETTETGARELALFRNDAYSRLARLLGSVDGSPTS
ncbi:3-hydroxyacyl-CoA dehydrogenase family protein [Arthrobacter mangrovi]|uniref:3-hydroxybutyryl-CoA dehydrogenase n=1 Tax=Arthrobacter mangrovi TaxID=2966350 RepID=A0ABQ5MW82_9MICC|nr:3-hydroxyacyl-CoA dehydrogenase family protein [Arthrobacter mangrovi]GLB68255.1 3-hydroxybutyryl-CoA dehydrogenase [Arthrobacter mangrovi]